MNILCHVSCLRPSVASTKNIFDAAIPLQVIDSAEFWEPRKEGLGHEEELRKAR